jgi:tetratricopeptide (TPR) repeat protein
MGRVSTCVGIAVLVAGARLLSAQDRPPRPALPAGADTNDAQAYYTLGISDLERKPDKAAVAFYWAALLNPTWADPYYGQWAARHLQDPDRYIDYLRKDKRTIQSREVMQIDSLYLRALSLNPFLFPKFELQMLDAVTTDVADRIATRSFGRISVTDAKMQMNAALFSNPMMIAAREYYQGQFTDALRDYALALSRTNNKTAIGTIRSSRGRIFFQIDNPDSALVELTSAIELMRASEKKDLVFLYQSRALTEQALGLVYRRLDRIAEARESFGRALLEDLSYYPAHVQLAMIALDSKQPDVAANEMDLAVQIKSDDAALRFLYGFTLGMIAKPKDAETQLRKAIELDPYYSAPYELLAEALEAQQRPGDALKEYRRFLAIAAMTDPRRASAGQRAQELAALPPQ